MLKIFKQNAFFKVFSLNAFSVGASFVFGIISTKIVSVFLGPQGMAFLGSFRNFSSMMRLTSTLGINNSLVKLYIENKEDKKELAIIFTTFFWLFLGVSVFLAALILLFSNSISQVLFFSNQYEIYIKFFGVVIPFMVVNAFWLAIYNGLEQFKKITYISIIGNFIVFLVSIYLIYEHKIEGALLSIVVSEIVLTIATFLFVCNDLSYFKFDLQKIISKKYYHIILKFSSMALLSAIIVPVTLILIRNLIVNNNSINDAGIWDGVVKLSNFYMVVFGSGLSLYYLPKLAKLKSDIEFKNELKFYFRSFIPFVAIALLIVFFVKNYIVQIAFTKEFSAINDVLIWQLAGDFVRMLTLAFGYQIVVKTMMKEYFFLEITYNLAYYFLAFYLVEQFSFLGALQAYFYANVFILMCNLFIFRKVIFKPTVT
jgi:O-antigen/teichoic acid export membrane protein